MNTPFRDWARFLRLPNVLTVPGDVWAGAALVGLPLPGAPWPALCLAFLYGMALNDLADLRKDRLSRPERPLPSGRVPLPAALAVCAALGLLACALHPAPPMFGLLITITAYDTLKERLPGSGPALMAACRVQTLWIGAGAPLSPPPAFWGAAVVWAGFILGVTALARREATETSPGKRLPALTLGLTLAPALLAFNRGVPARWPEPLLLCALLPALAWNLHRRIGTRGKVLPSDIGRYLMLLFPLQALVLSLHGAPAAAWTVLAGWPLLRILSRRIPPS